MNILICHERFLFRFGADRVLILLGKGLSEQGHRVTLMGNRCDTEIVRGFADKWIQTPVEDGPYLELDESTRDWLEHNWNSLFEHGREPDAVVVGGWPFISAIPFFRKTGARVIFVDFGVVPNDGYSEGTVTVLNKLHRLRLENLRHASVVVAISRFIAESQSQPEAGSVVPVRSVLLGADHMETGVWHAAGLKLESEAERKSASVLLDSLRAQNRKLLLSLGRWEPGCYKNSQAAFDVIGQLAAGGFNCALLVLEQPQNVNVPEQLRNLVYPIGFPDDEELREIMKEVDLGISMSLWEGFNLPLAEMQWYGKAALAFRVGAHPEVIAHSWFLCQNVAEMFLKSAALLRGEGPPDTKVAVAISQFRAYFTYRRFIEDFCKLFTEGQAGQNEHDADRDRTLLVDVTSATKDPANPGVIRVTRRLGRELQEAGVEPVFVVWDEQQEAYVLPTEAEYAILGRFNGPKLTSHDRVSNMEATPIRRSFHRFAGSERWLILPEVLPESRFRKAREFARQWKLRIAIIFYDAIPYLRPELCHPDMGANHTRYMRAIAECDVAFPISRFSADCLLDFWRETRTAAICQVTTDVLPGEFGSVRRAGAAQRKSPPVRILCVSTLEPRKNHRNLVQACLWLKENHPELDWSLTLVGNRYVGAFDIAEWIQEICAQEPRIEWLGIVDDATLDRLYEECSFTVYPSLLEGFGLPIVESIWYGRPCICRNQGVMAELAETGGCLTADVTDPVLLGKAIYLLGTNDALWSKLAREAVERPLRTWREYTLELLDALRTFSPLEGHAALKRMLFPHCSDDWTMSESERMALLALISRHQPECSVVFGAKESGATSLISQYSKLTFSVNADCLCAAELQRQNVSYLNGSPDFVVPGLFAQLQRDALVIGFVYFEGDSGLIETGLTCLLKYVPEQPFFAVVRDSFDSEHRQALLNIDWQFSPYCHWLELDFVPGRLGSSGPSGGLALAYFHPEKRSCELPIRRSACKMLERLSLPAVT